MPSKPPVFDSGDTLRLVLMVFVSLIMLALITAACVIESPFTLLLISVTVVTVSSIMIYKI